MAAAKRGQEFFWFIVDERTGCISDDVPVQINTFGKWQIGPRSNNGKIIITPANTSFIKKFKRLELVDGFLSSARALGDAPSARLLLGDDLRPDALVRRHRVDQGLDLDQLVVIDLGAIR